MPKINRYTVVVEFEVEATSHERAKAAVMRGLDNGIADIREIEAAAITEAVTYGEED